MAHISLPPLPGIMSLMKYRPETGKVLSELAEVLMRGDSPLTPGERELIATFVSHRNECKFCSTSHGAVARLLLNEDSGVVDAVYQDIESAKISGKLKALLKIAAKVQISGKEVSAEDIKQAKAQGAKDREIHDTVLIAATFCMFNRYVDGLATTFPEDSSLFEQAACQITELGYIAMNKQLFESH